MSIETKRKKQLQNIRPLRDLNLDTPTRVRGGGRSEPQGQASLEPLLRVV